MDEIQADFQQLQNNLDSQENWLGGTRTGMGMDRGNHTEVQGTGVRKHQLKRKRLLTDHTQATQRMGT